LRLVLGAWLDRDPAALRFAAGPHGKPQLLHPGPSMPQGKMPEFNISHSGDLILLAFHAAAPVGVDVERQQPDLDWRPIARRCLAPVQVESLLALPQAEAASAFVESWCDLEAGLKARGVGLAQASEVQALAIKPRLRRWRLDLPAGYSGAVALLDPA
jgi:4'-phosphopantetheinyl transferase